MSIMESLRLFPVVIYLCVLLHAGVFVESIRVSIELDETIKNQIRQEIRDFLATEAVEDSLKDGNHVDNAVLPDNEIEKDKKYGHVIQITDDLRNKYNRLYHAFQTEKHRNRELKREFDSFRDRFEDKLDGMANDMESLNNSVNIKVKEVVENLDHFVGNVRDVAEDILTVTADVRTVTEDVQTVTEDVRTVTEDVRTVTEDVSTVTEDVRTVTADVRTVTADVRTVTEDVRTVSEDVRTVTEDVRTVEENVRQCDMNIESVRNNVNKVNEKVREVVEQIEDVTENVETVTKHVQESNNKFKEQNILVKTLKSEIEKQMCNNAPISGIYDITFDIMKPSVPVYCDQDTDGGGWIVILRRADGSVNFTRSWSDYKKGFGNKEGEFWAGNDILHELTSSKRYQLRVDLEDIDGDKIFAQYEHFEIGPEEDKYRLKVSGYSGTAGDSLIDPGYSTGVSNGKQFSTFDSDNDRWGGRNCADKYKAGWWFNYCSDSILAGVYRQTGTRPGGQSGIRWYTATHGYYRTSFMFAEMKMRHI